MPSAFIMVTEDVTKQELQEMINTLSKTEWVATSKHVTISYTDKNGNEKIIK